MWLVAEEDATLDVPQQETASAVELAADDPG